jgi:hypothetical protein
MSIRIVFLLQVESLKLVKNSNRSPLFPAFLKNANFTENIIPLFSLSLRYLKTRYLHSLPSIFIDKDNLNLFQLSKLVEKWLTKKFVKKKYSRESSRHWSAPKLFTLFSQNFTPYLIHPLPMTPPIDSKLLSRLVGQKKRHFPISWR